MSAGTVPVLAHVLAVVRTLTSLNRLLDVLPVFADDLRIQLTFTLDGGSEFSDGVDLQLRALGARLISWPDAKKAEFDLILSASDHGDLHELRGPLVLFPHGAGYQKYTQLPDPSEELSGLSPGALREDGPGTLANLVLSHENQRAQLAEVAPHLENRAVVVGDPCLDRMLAAARDRASFRAALGVAPHQKLVTLTSTWGPRSLLSRWSDLPARLLAQLPSDEFRVAAVLHPNIWTHHSRWQIHTWLDRAEEAGLILLPPAGPWQLGLLAADCVLGDHGSLSAYTTGLEIPLLLAAFGTEEVPPGTAMDALGRQIARLDPHRPLAAQLDHAITTHDPDSHRALADEVFAMPGQSLATLQKLLYDLIGLEPVHPARHRPFSRELPAQRRPLSFHVETELSADGAVVRRFPAVLEALGDAADGRHLVSAEDEPSHERRQTAAIILHRGEPAEGWAKQTLSAFPFCQLAVALNENGGLTAFSRDDRQITATLSDRSDGFAPELAASALYTVLARDPARTVLPIRSGTTSAILRIVRR